MFLCCFLSATSAGVSFALRRIRKHKQMTHQLDWANPGAHHQEPATTPYSCRGVFTDRPIFILNLSRIEIPTGTSVTSCNQKHGLMSTCSREAALFYDYRSVLM